MRKHSCFVWPTGVHRFIDPSHVKCVFSWPQSWCKVGSRQTGTKGGDPSLHSYLQHATVSLNSLTLCFFFIFSRFLPHVSLISHLETHFLSRGYESHTPHPGGLFIACQCYRFVPRIFAHNYDITYDTIYFLYDL